jgi:cytochrome c oxidase subunit 2
VSRFRALFSSVCASIWLSGCSLWPSEQNPFSTVDSSSDFNDAIIEVYSLITWITCIVGVLVAILMAYVIIKFRDDGLPGNPEQIHGNTTMEIGWTLIPVVLVIFMVVPTISTIFEIADAAPDDAIEIRVVGKRWWWEFEYIEEGIVTANEIHVPAGTPVNLLIESDSVIHSFWVPRLGGKRDAVPGRINRMWWTIKDEVAPGETIRYRGECAEYCGESHALMRFDVIAHDDAGYAEWVELMKAPPIVADAAIREAGEEAYAAGGCVGCHALTNIDGAVARIGPNLTRLGIRQRIAAGTMENSVDNLASWIENQEEWKAGTSYDKLGNPRFDGMLIPVELSEQQVDALATYLSALQ